ncbi:MULTISPECIES: hypothetical protein [unclassified Synechococcus]|uniref:hypothetical protein n=1 Tax=unclassified Synechococcus TaxID=2626047 RepID=UPI0021A68B59|nr:MULTISPECIES: hypothetical protein [unclassified Synechococcus]MCT0212339.1 hypothetical protein [Synechococcus sp. CS-1326]MCT0234248.1 hypothetical protein [Synechococcus sp. CS-1327]
MVKPVRIGGGIHGPAENDGYQLVKLLPGVTGVKVSSARPMAGSRSDEATPVRPV